MKRAKRNPKGPKIRSLQSRLCLLNEEIHVYAQQTVLSGMDIEKLLNRNTLPRDVCGAEGELALHVWWNSEEPGSG